MVRIEVGNIRTLLLSMNSTWVSVMQATARCVDAAGEVMLREVRSSVSRTEHSLDDLRAKDHPYARRHGAIRSGVLGGAFVQRPYLVHRQSGDMLASIRGASSSVGGGPAFEVGTSHPHARFVIEGSRVLLRRDFLIDTMNEKRVQREILRAMVRVLGSELRTQATIRGARHAVAPSTTEA
jgi:hypothetical protein